MRVICYTRVSAEDQATNGVSLEAQAAKLAAYASLYELAIVETISDAGESAKSLNRPGLQRALAMLRKGEADGLVVVKLDRLTRSVGDWQTLIDSYFGEKAGKQLMSVSDSIDTRTAGGRMCLNLLLVVSQWEREVIAERTKEALRVKISRSERCGKVRFGFDLDADGNTLIENPTEQAAISTMVELRQSGATYRAIAAELTERGIMPKESSKWDHSAVRRILARAG